MDRYRIKIYPAAKRDLAGIVDYLNTLSEDAAIRYFDRIIEEIGSLATIPERRPIRGTWRFAQKDTDTSS